MNRIVHVLVVVFLFTLAFGQDERASYVVGLAASVAQESDLVMMDCPTGLAVAHAACVIGSSSASLDRRILDLYVPRFAEWGTPWVTVNARSYGRAILSPFGHLNVMVTSLTARDTLIVFWFPVE
jgi:hypothetical protein